MTELIEMYIQLGLLGSIGVIFIWMLVRQNIAMTESTKMFQKQGEILNNIYEALKPGTYVQASDLFSIIIAFSEKRIMEILHDIIRKNNIHEEGHEDIIRENIKGELTAMFTHHQLTLKRHQYSGKTLDIYMYDWTPEIAKVMLDELYNNGKPDEDRFKKNIGGVFYRIKNNIENELSKG